MTTPNNTVAGLAEKWRAEADEMDRRGEGTGGAAYMHAEANKIRARAAELESALASPAPSAGAGTCEALVWDLATNGLRFDTTPCLDWTSKESIHQFWSSYFRQADESIRERAERALQHPAAPSAGVGVEGWVSVADGLPPVDTMVQVRLAGGKNGESLAIGESTRKSGTRDEREWTITSGGLYRYWGQQCDGGSVTHWRRLAPFTPPAAAPSAPPSVAGDAGELPELPRAAAAYMRGCNVEIADGTRLYTADQMRAYGEQCHRLATAEQPTKSIRVGFSTQGDPMYANVPAEQPGSAVQGKVASFADGVKSCIAWVEKRRHDFEEEWGSVDPSTNTMEFGTVEREEYDAELVEIEEGLRGLLTTPPPEARGVEGMVPADPWRPINELEPSDDLFWFARWDGRSAWVVDEPRKPQHGGYDADEWDWFAPAAAPPLAAAPSGVRVDEMEDLLRSAHEIALRQGADTNWEGLAKSIAKIGIGPITARHYFAEGTPRETINKHLDALLAHVNAALAGKEGA